VSDDGANRIVLDLETKRSFDEVGGAKNRDRLGVSLVGIYHYRDDAFRSYREGELERLGEVLKTSDDIVGFNLVGFDMPLLAAELGDWVLELPTTDLMLEAQRALGHRVSLQSIASATLGSGKLGSGLDALEYYRAGDWDKL
jgi:DEAD/DEAH box helicase domain-containing protein